MFGVSLLNFGDIEPAVKILTLLGGFGAALWVAFTYFFKNVIEPQKAFLASVEKLHKDISELQSTIKNLQSIQIGKDANESRQVKELVVETHHLVQELISRYQIDFMIDSQPKIEFDANFFCIQVNDSFTKVTGLSRLEAEGRGWLKCMVDFDAERVNKRIYSNLEAGVPIEVENFKLRNGKNAYLRVFAVKSANVQKLIATIDAPISNNN